MPFCVKTRKLYPPLDEAVVVDDEDEDDALDLLEAKEDELGELEEELDELAWVPGADMMNIPTTSITRTPTAAAAISLLFKRVPQFGVRFKFRE